MNIKSYSFRMSSNDGEFFNKVRTIKGLRLLSGLGLKESKELVEEVQQAYPNTFRADLETNHNPKDVEDALSLMASGGIEVIDNDAPLRAELLDKLKVVAADAVATGQYDIARSLIDILVATK